MANANEITEQVKLLLNVPTVGDNAQFSQEVNQFLADADLFNEFARRVPRNGRGSGGGGGAGGLSAEDLEAQQQLSAAAATEIDRVFDSLNLNEEQAYLSRVGGELGAVIDRKLNDELQKVNKREPTGERAAVLRQAVRQLQAEELAFQQNTPGAVPYDSLSGDKVKDLASADSFMDVVKKGAATGLAGIPGLAGIAASAVGFEDAGQTLGGLAADIRGKAPTDIQSSAASQQMADIQRRVSLDDDDPLKLSLSEAATKMAGLAVTDGDVFQDLLANTTGSVVGGGAVRAGVTAAARGGAALAGRVTGRGGAAASTAGTATERAATANANLFNPVTQSAGTRLAQGTANAAPAIGVGLGSGVDGTLTTPQAQLLAATGLVSSGLAGGLGLLGAGTAETALSQAGAAAGRLPVINRIPGLGGQAAQTTADLAPIGTGQIARNAVGRTIGTSAGESAQEFVEGAGESLAGAGADGNLTEEDFRQAGITGALQAPLGAVIGAPAGAVGSVAGDREQNRQNEDTQRFRDDSRAELQAQKQTARQAVTDARTNASDVRRAAAEADQASVDAIRQGNAQAIAQEQQVFQERETAIAERQQSLREPFVDDGVDPSVLPLAERRARAQAQAEGVPRDITRFVAGTGRTAEGLDALLTAEPAEAELELRAMYRNQGLDPQKEDAFIDRVSVIDFEPLNVPQGADAIAAAAAQSQADPAAVQRGTNEALEAEAAATNQARDAEIASAEESLVAEQAAQEQAFNEQVTQRRQAAGETLNRVFAGTVTERNAGRDSFTTSARDLDRIPLTDTLFAAESESGTPRTEVIGLYNEIIKPEVSGEQVAEIFKTLASDTNTPEGFAEAFGTRMATSASRWKTPAQMVQAARNYIDIYAPDEVFNIPEIRSAILNDPDPENVLASLRQNYAPEVADSFSVEDGSVQLSAEAQAEAQSISERLTDDFIANEAGNDLEGTGLAEGLAKVKAVLKNTAQAPLTGEQANDIAAALDEGRTLLNQRDRQAEQELKAKRSASAQKGVQTRRRNAARRDASGSRDFTPDSPNDVPGLNGLSEITAQVQGLLDTKSPRRTSRSAEPTFDADASFVANEDGTIGVSEQFRAQAESAIQEEEAIRLSAGGTGSKRPTTGVRPLLSRIRKGLGAQSLSAEQAADLGDAVTRLRGINAKKQSPAADGDQSATQAVDSYGDKAGTELEGLDGEVLVDGTLRRFTGLKSAQDAARAYVESTGREYVPIQTYAPVDEARARRIADAYEQMEHNPRDPEVAASYRAMIDETYGQYQAMLDAGVVVEFNPTGTDPYGNPRNAILDVVENNHLYVFSTKEGYGDAANVDVSDNPMLEVSPYTFNGQPALANDVFRAVHDYYGHIQHGLGFRSRGEDNAWRSHATMYSAAARPAATAETRGQNSWVNFGPFAGQNSTASGTDTRFADQKIGLLPDWAMEDAELDFSSDTPTPIDSSDFDRILNEQRIPPGVDVSQTQTPEFQAFFKDSKVVAENGEPLIVYHGSTTPDGQGAFDSDTGFRESPTGLFFSPSAQIAAVYAQRPLLDPETDALIGFETEGGVQAAYLSIQNPLVIDARGSRFNNLNNIIANPNAQTLPPTGELDPNLTALLDQAGLSSRRNGSPGERFSINSIKGYAEQLGYDGAIVSNVKDSGSDIRQTQYIAFSPTQVKSATDNSGSFDPTNPNTRRSISRPANTSVPAARSPAPQGLLPGESASEQLGLFTPSDVEGAVQRLTQSWKAKPKLVVVESNQDLPDTVKPTDGSTVFGITDGDTVYLVSDQFTSESQIADALNEEVFHKGLMRSLGGNYDPELSRIFNKRGGVDGILALARKYKTPNSFFDNYRDVISDAQSGNREAQRELTDEVMAQISQATNLASGIKADLKTMLSKIKKYLRKFFPKEWFDTVSDGDILQTIRDANTAGRNDLTDYSGPVRIRARRDRPGDYPATDANGNQIIKNYFEPLPREVTTSVQDAQQLTKNYWTELKDNWKANTLGEAIYKSSVWQGLQKRIANAKIALEVVEFSVHKIDDQGIRDIFKDIESLDLPPFAKEILAGANNDTLKRELLSVDTSVALMNMDAEYLAREGLKVDVDGKEVPLTELIGKFNEAKAAVQGYLNISPDVASSYISRFVNAEHAPERNDITFLKTTELFDSAAQAERTQIFTDINNDRAGPEGVARVRELVAEHGSPELRAEFKGAGMTDAESAEIIGDMTQDPAQKVLFEKAAQALYTLIDGTSQIEQQTGSFSNSLRSAKRAYGWTKYIPLRGKGIDPDEEAGDAFTTHFADNTFSTTFRPTGGRESLVDDVTATVYKNAINSVAQNAGQKFVDTVIAHAAAEQGSGTYANRMADDSFGGKLLVASIEQMDLNSPQFKAAMANKDAKRLVRYDPANNGADIQRALVVTLANDRAADAVLGAKNQLAEGINDVMRRWNIKGVGIHDVTSFMSSLKTWRNPPFITFDALRQMMTLGLDIASQEGFPGFQRYLRMFTAPGSKTPSQILLYSRLYQQGDFAQIKKKVAEFGEGSVFAEMDEFTRLGGATSQLSAVRDVTPGSIASLERVPGNALTRKMAGLDEMLGYLNVAADSMSRLAYFRALKAGGMSPRIAAGKAKNTANFEKRGTWSGPMSGLFEFFRPTAVGASALINSALTGPYARETAAVTFGAGAALYVLANMFAGVDDEGNDRMAEVNGKLFNRNFVWQYGDSPKERLQMGMGHGVMAAAASSGIQAARLMLGHQSLSQSLDNSTNALKDQLTVLPVSGISVVTDPTAFVFNSLVPGILKPWYETSVNFTSQGIPVRSDFRGAESGDLTASFSGRFNSEAEMYDDITEFMQNSGLADVNPDDLRHLMRSYGGTLSYLMEAVYENVKAVTSDEEFAYSKKAGWYFARQFVGSEFSQTPENFYNHYNRIESLKNLVREERKSGDDEAADAIEDSELYQNSIAAFDRAKKRREEANDRNREVFDLDATSTAERREVGQIRDEELLDIAREYLDAVRE